MSSQRRGFSERKKKMLFLSKSFSSLVSLPLQLTNVYFGVEQSVQAFKIPGFISVFWGYFLFSELLCFLFALFDLFTTCKFHEASLHSVFWA